VMEYLKLEIMNMSRRTNIHGRELLSEMEGIKKELLKFNQKLEFYKTNVEEYEVKKETKIIDYIFSLNDKDFLDFPALPKLDGVSTPIRTITYYDGILTIRISDLPSIVFLICILIVCSVVISGFFCCLFYACKFCCKNKNCCRRLQVKKTTTKTEVIEMETTNNDFDFDKFELPKSTLGRKPATRRPSASSLFESPTVTTFKPELTTPNVFVPPIAPPMPTVPLCDLIVRSKSFSGKSMIGDFVQDFPKTVLKPFPTPDEKPLVKPTIPPPFRRTSSLPRSGIVARMAARNDSICTHEVQVENVSSMETEC
jgi:hypothetical protein